MVKMFKDHRPLFWWAERGHITKSIGPYLRKRMVEEGAYASLVELTPIGNKQQRAQSIKGRMAGGKVHFPSWTSWYGEARNQLLTFPAGSGDDFVDALSMIGLGLSHQVRARSASPRKAHAPGTFGAMKAAIQQAELAAQIDARLRGW